MKIAASWIGLLEPVVADDVKEPLEQPERIEGISHHQQERSNIDLSVGTGEQLIIVIVGRCCCPVSSFFSLKRSSKRKQHRHTSVDGAANLVSLRSRSSFSHTVTLLQFAGHQSKYK